MALRKSRVREYVLSSCDQAGTTFAEAPWKTLVWLYGVQRIVTRINVYDDTPEHPHFGS